MSANMPLKNDAAAQIDTIDQVVLVPQSNLEVNVTSSDTGMAGLLGSLIFAGIDAIRRSSAQEEAAPIIAELQDYDFRQVMLGAMTSEVSSQAVSSYKIDTKLETVDSDSNRQILFTKSKANAVMFNTVSYQVISGNLVITSRIEMYPKSEALGKYRDNPQSSNALSEGNLIYKGFFTYKMQGVTKENIESGLTNGAQDIARQIINDITHPESQDGQSRLALAK